MGIQSIGKLIRRERKRAGLSQDKLSDGLCSAESLSRYERGQREISKDLFDALMQRTGATGDMYAAYVSEIDFEIHDNKFLIRQALAKADYEEAGRLLEIVKQQILSIKERDRHLHNQFITYAEAYTKAKGAYTLELLRELEKAIRFTLPNYDTMKLHDCVLTFDELAILNIICIAYAEIGQREKSIDRFYELKAHMEAQFINTEEKMKMYPPILYNLSKYLGLEGRYEESIEISELGIAIISEYGRSMLAGRILFNKGWCLVKLEDEQRLPDCRKVLLQAYYVELTLGSPEMAERFKEFGIKNCPLIQGGEY